MTDLSLLEATPALGLLAGLPLAAIVRWRSWLQAKNPFSDPICQTDLLAGAYVLGLSLFYLQALPVNATWTVRYLLPTVPFGLYFVARLPPVRHVVHEAPRLLAYAWTVQVLVGGQFVLLYLLSINATRGEVVRFHALLGILAAAVGAVWVVLALLDLVDDARVGAVALSVPLAAGTLYYLLAGLEYFVVGPFALGLVEALSRAIPLF